VAVRWLPEALTVSAFAAVAMSGGLAVFAVMLGAASLRAVLRPYAWR
jgi:hypothetical protein